MIHVVGMTGDAAEVVHRETKVWTKSYTEGPREHGSWLWYLSR
ncbi:MAG TPA: hypothetical protein VGH74_05855 [Planctomycetaceae bacterium]|jgi:hypothetical protein